LFSTITHGSLEKNLFINPSKWGRAITYILIACHSYILKKNHQVELFECTFYLHLTDNEVKQELGF
jgi:hypothetical protein